MKYGSNWPLGSTALDGFFSVFVSPNPFINELKFLVNIPEAAKSTLAVYDVLGREVAVKEIDLVKGTNEVMFHSTDSWGNGIFTYELKAAQWSSSGRVVKQ